MINAIVQVLIFGGYMTADKKRVVENKFTVTCRLTVMGTAVSFAGWCFEKIGRMLVYGDNGDRGFLTLPLCPIYGISVVAVFLLCGTPTFLRGVIGARIRKSRIWERVVKNKTWRKYLFYFIFVTVLATLSELVVGLIAKAAGTPLWDYSQKAFNFMGVICLSFSLMWGTLITAFMGLAWKPSYTLIHKIPAPTVKKLGGTLAVAVATDFTVNVIMAVLGKR